MNEAKFYLEKLRHSLAPLRQQIIEHPLYFMIQTVEDLKIFMQFHVYAVWDFMSLLKTLQNRLTCTSIPWFPHGFADTRLLINEIVSAEESDLDESGNLKSHFELYLEAMRQSGCNTDSFENFLSTLKANHDFAAAFSAGKTPVAAIEFVEFTFKIIRSEKEHIQAAVFTFAREELIPQMFLSILKDLTNRFPNKVSVFQYYLQRHIEIDGNRHSQMATQMTANLCGNDPKLWQEAEEAAIAGLQKRLQLWDGVQEQLTRNS